MDYVVIENENSFRSYPVRKYKKSFKIMDLENNTLVQGVCNDFREVLHLLTEDEGIQNGKLYISNRGRSKSNWHEYKKAIAFEDLRIIYDGEKLKPITNLQIFEMHKQISEPLYFVWDYQKKDIQFSFHKTKEDALNNKNPLNIQKIDSKKLDNNYLNEIYTVIPDQLFMFIYTANDNYSACDFYFTEKDVRKEFDRANQEYTQY